MFFELNFITVNCCSTLYEDPMFWYRNPKQISFTDPKMLPARNSKYSGTIVLDFDETLINARAKPVCYIRPYVFEFFYSIRTHLPHIEIIGWSAGLPEHVDRVIELLNDFNPHHGLQLFDMVLSRGPAWHSESTTIKDLSMLKRTDCIIIDDSPYAAIYNSSAIIVPTFNPTKSMTKEDTTLLFVLQVVVRSFRLRHIKTRGRDAAITAGIPDHYIDIFLTINDMKAYIDTHPYILRTTVDTLDGIIDCMYLDVSNISIVRSRIKYFRHRYSQQSLITSIPIYSRNPDTSDQNSKL